MRELHQADTADADADEGDARTALTHDEGTPLLGNTSCDEQGRTIANGDGQVTYKREIWGFIGTALKLLPIVYRADTHRDGFIPGYMIPIFGNQVLWKYFSVLGPVTQMGKHGTLALAGAALGERVTSSTNLTKTLGHLRKYLRLLQPTVPLLLSSSFLLMLQVLLWTHFPPKHTVAVNIQPFRT